jgi:peptidyl-tRNA hydrolase, PTH1 family
MRWALFYWGWSPRLIGRMDCDGAVPIMWLVTGLGNPGKKYDGTRHNIGFEVVTALASGVQMAGKFSGRFGRSPDTAFLMPETFMNLSGESVQPAAAFLKLGADRVLVVHDELDLPFGTVRIKVGGGHAGHNGLRSIIARLGADFVRVRVGVGRPPPDFKGDVADFVLNKFSAEEKPQLAALIQAACQHVDAVLAEGAEKAMNRLHVTGK